MLFRSDKVALILGDNLLIGKGLGRDLQENLNVDGASIFGTVVSDPSAYGVAILDENNKITDFVEKPAYNESKIAIPGLYFFDETVFEKANKLKPSARGEFEITDLLRLYLDEDKIKLKMLERGSTWLDCGTPDQLHDASEMIRVLQKRQGLNYGNPYEIINSIAK